MIYLKYLADEIKSLFAEMVALLVQTIAALILMIPVSYFIFGWTVDRLFEVAFAAPVVIAWSNCFHPLNRKISKAFE